MYKKNNVSPQVCSALAALHVVVLGCNGSTQNDGGAGDAIADCHPFALIPDVTEFTCAAVDGGPGCLGDPQCQANPGACDGGAQVYPPGCQATLPTKSGSDVNCQGPPAGSYCLCSPLACTCNAADAAGPWYCPN
jgi:hypothetical protein